MKDKITEGIKVSWKRGSQIYYGDVLSARGDSAHIEMCCDDHCQQTTTSNYYRNI